MTPDCIIFSLIVKVEVKFFISFYSSLPSSSLYSHSVFVVVIRTVCGILLDSQRHIFPFISSQKIFNTQILSESLLPLVSDMTSCVYVAYNTNQIILDVTSSCLCVYFMCIPGGASDAVCYCILLYSQVSDCCIIGFPHALG